MLTIAVLVLLAYFAGCNLLSPMSKYGETGGAPFPVQNAGAKAEFEIDVREHRAYSFSLFFMFDENNPPDRDRVKKLVGSYETGSNGKPIDPGVSILLRLRVASMGTLPEQVIVDKTVSDMALTSWGANSFSKMIDRFPLKPGRYRASVESLKDVPELAATQVNLGYGFAAKVRPISNN